MSASPFYFYFYLRAKTAGAMTKGTHPFWDVRHFALFAEAVLEFQKAAVVD
jgi:hypothetical protein